MEFSRFQFVALASMSLMMCGCRPREQPLERAISPSELVETFRANRLETEAEVERVVSHAGAAERAVMFIHVDWAPMEPQQTRFAELILAYRKAHSRDDLKFFYVDCSAITQGYASLRQLRGWKELEAARGTSLVHGWGELIWLRQGQVLAGERILDVAPVSEALKKTEQLLPPSDGV